MRVKIGKILAFWMSAAALFMFLVSPFDAPAQTDRELKLDGISYEKENPSGSIAVINGEFFKTGDAVGNYEVAEIAPQSVRLKFAGSGETIELSLLDQKPKAANAPAVKEAAPASTVKQGQGGEKKEGGTGFGFRKLFAGVTNLWWEGIAVSDMGKIQGAAFRHLMRVDNPPTLQSLVKEGAIPKDLGDGLSGKYRFRLKVNGLDFEIFADPVETDTNLHHLYMDRLKIVRYEYGKSAGAKSPFYRSEMYGRSLLKGH